MGTGFRKIPEDRLEILVDAEHYDNRQYSSRFTIAEELSHLLIHAEYFKNIHSPDDRIAFQQALTDEQDKEFQSQARRYGSYLLVPNALFLSLCDDWVLNNYDEILKDNPQNENELIKFLAEKLQHKLEVSSRSLEIVFFRYIDGVRIIDCVVSRSSRKLITPR
jgi:Zn-dependent peptidase ImmA (M78 family)